MRVWHYTATFNDLNKVDSNGDPLQHRGSRGVYVVADAAVFEPRGRSGHDRTAFDAAER